MFNSSSQSDESKVKIIPDNYVEKVYAGWLGKVIGVRHGANIEQWSYDRIKKAYGEITTYVHNFKNFAADDDTNGPLFFIRSLEDFTYTRDITPEQMGLTWLNYVPDGHGFFWWGGYGVSTENTVYLNLKNGIMAPDSGSKQQNGINLAEQIGGQIFIDVWGLVTPNQPKLAAEYAGKMASVSHDSNGKYGGMFIAASIAASFGEKNIERIIENGLSVIPENCEYAKVTRDIIRYYKEKPENWRDCFQYVYDHYGYDKYPGVCHVIPNTAVIILSLLYGEGDFSRTINICNMCGWDTDCNAANVGTIIGVRNGLEGIDYSWREPINDFLCCSSVIGSLNILDIPQCASYIARLGYKIAETSPPEKWKSILEGNAAKYHFEYPGSTHAFRVDRNVDEEEEGLYYRPQPWNIKPMGKVENSFETSYSGSGSLKAVFDYVNGGIGYRIFVKTYYTPEDFDDSRYDPGFSPLLYPGQMIESYVKVPDNGICKMRACLYVKDRNGNKRYYSKPVQLSSEKWERIEYKIPFMSGVCIEEAGLEFIPVQSMQENESLIVYVDSFNFSGQPDYEVNYSKEKLEEWHSAHIEVSQHTYLRGLWSLENGCLSGRYYGETAETYTGDLNWKNYIFEADIIPASGQDHRINVRVQGGIRSYAVGFADKDTLVLYKNINGYKLLKSTKYKWQRGIVYTIKVKSVDKSFFVYVDDQLLLEYEDHVSPYLTGQVGFSNANGSHTLYKRFKVTGL